MLITQIQNHSASLFSMLSRIGFQPYLRSQIDNAYLTVRPVFVQRLFVQGVLVQSISSNPIRLGQIRFGQVRFVQVRIGRKSLNEKTLDENELDEKQVYRIYDRCVILLLCVQDLHTEKKVLTLISIRAVLPLRSIRLEVLPELQHPHPIVCMFSSIY